MPIKGFKHSEETKRKMSESHKGKKGAWFGKHHSPEYRKKQSEAHKGEKNGRTWKGGRIKTSWDYIRVWCPNHPHADGSGYVFEHRLVMEAHLGRTLLPTEVVHHINGITDDNRVENLMLFSDNAEHRRYHKKSKLKKEI